MVESLSFWVRIVSVKTIVFIHKVRNTVKYDGTRDISEVDWRADTDHIGTAHVGKRSLARQSTSQLGFRHLALAFVSSVVNCSASGGAVFSGKCIAPGTRALPKRYGISGQLRLAPGRRFTAH